MRAANGIFICIIVSMLLLGCSFQPELAVRTVEKGKAAIQPEITIYVSGQVLKPGTYRLAKGSSLSAAIAAAGGLTQQADVRTVNLEEVLDSTAQLYVPAVGEVQAKQAAEGKSIYSPIPRTEPVVAESSPPPPPLARQTPVYRPSGSLTELERQMIEMVNSERSSRGLKTLAVDYGLVKTARLKSQDMIDNSYFDHVSPKWGTMSELFASQGVTYRLAGENLPSPVI